MKVKTQVLKTKDGKIVHRAFPWDSPENRQYNLRRLEKKTGEPLHYEDGPESEVIQP